MLTMTTHPRKELQAWLASLIAGFRRRRQFGDSLRLKVAQDIVSDISTLETKACDTAFDSEQADLAAVQLITPLLNDPRIPADDLPVLRKALRNIRNSATADHRISELLG